MLYVILCIVNMSIFVFPFLSCKHACSFTDLISCSACYVCGFRQVIVVLTDLEYVQHT